MPAPRASHIQERDAMRCRSCGNEERASEGYPCASCGTFLCLMCVFKGVVRCSACVSTAADATVQTDAVRQRPIEQAPRIDWPEH